MKLAGMVAVILLAGAAGTPAQSRVAGDWKAIFVGPIGPRPKMVAAVTFSIRDTPSGLIGAARASNWPGDLEVTDIKLDGDRLTFTGTGAVGSSSTRNGVRTESCCPKLVFEGTIRGDEIDLAMTWTSTDPHAGPASAPLPMLARRVTE